MVTGLYCSPLYEPDTENNDDDYRIVDEFLDRNCAITIKEFHTKFLQAKSNDDMKMVKLAMLYFVEFVLLGKENKNYINETNVLLVDNFTEFNEFPWGRISFKMTIGNAMLTFFWILGCLSEMKTKLGTSPIATFNFIRNHPHDASFSQSPTPNAIG